MADQVAITPGAGVDVSTDDCGASGHVQRVKLAYGANSDATQVPADADGLLVNLGANNDVTVTGVATAANQATVITHLDGVEALLTTIDADTSALAGAVSGTEVQVDIVGALPAGTNAIGKLAANSGVDIGDVDIQGGLIAHDDADSGNPVKVGAKAQAAAASVTVVAAGDRTNAVSDLDGALITRVCRLADLIADVLAITDGSSTAFSGSFAAAANLYNYITSVTIANTSVTAVTVDLRDGAAGSVLYTFPVPANTSGITVAFNPPLRQPTVNTALAADPSAAATTVTTSVNGFKSKA